MQIDLLETQTQKFPLYDEACQTQIGWLEPDHNGHLKADDEKLDQSLNENGGSYDQFDEEDGEEKFRVCY